MSRKFAHLKERIYWTDGSNSVPKGPGIVGFACTDGDERTEDFDYEATLYCTNQRAELRAIGLAAKQVPPEERAGTLLQIRSDSEWCVNTLKLGLQAAGKNVGAPSLYRKVRQTDEHGVVLPTYEVWREVLAALLQYGAVELVHIKGHAKKEEVAEGRVSLDNFLHNNRCDKLAGQARIIGQVEGRLEALLEATGGLCG